MKPAKTLHHALPNGPVTPETSTTEEFKRNQARKSTRNQHMFRGRHLLQQAPRELQTAFAVTQFTATFHGPNPFDADELFQKPLAVYLSEADGKKGKTQIDGTDLNREVLQSVTRSTAATGNEASAKVLKARGSRAVKIHLGGSTLGTSYEEEQHDPQVVLSDLQGLYQGVREDERA